jgi:hypothetical protein
MQELFYWSVYSNRGPEPKENTRTVTKQREAAPCRTFAFRSPVVFATRPVVSARKFSLANKKNKVHPAKDSDNETGQNPFSRVRFQLRRPPNNQPAQPGNHEKYACKCDPWREKKYPLVVKKECDRHGRSAQKHKLCQPQHYVKEQSERRRSPCVHKKMLHPSHCHFPS